MTFLLDEIDRTFARKITIENYVTSADVIGPAGQSYKWHAIRVAGAKGSLDARELFNSAEEAATAEIALRSACGRIGVAIL